jgi:hypothetical protein
MLKTGRVSALHAGTNPVANPGFDTVVVLLSNRLLFNRLRFDPPLFDPPLFDPLRFNPLSTVRPSRPGKTLHHDQ